MTGRVRNFRPFWRRGDSVGVRGWQPGDGVGFSAGTALDVDRHAIADRDKAQRQAAALAVEVEQLKTRLAEVEAERDSMAQSLIVTATRNGDLRRLLASSPGQVRQTCLDLSDQVAKLRRQNAELQRKRAS